MRVKLDLIVAGSCRHPACMVTGKTGLKTITFPSLVGRITHPTRGTILFDAGYGEVLSGAQDWLARCYRHLLPYKLAPGEACVHQLAAAGVHASEVTAVILSHLHPDHVGGLADFPNAKVYLSRQAFEALTTSNFFARARLGFMTELFPTNLSSRIMCVEDGAHISLNSVWSDFGEGIDIFGDSSVTVIPLPGHSPGHFGVRLKTTKDQDVFLVADAAWLSCCYREMLEPLFPARFFTHDYVAYRKTMLKIHNLAKVNKDIAIVPSHCADAIRSLQNALA